MPLNELDRLRAALSAPPPPERPLATEHRSAAVALIFSPGAAGLELLMIRRAVHRSDPWSGHMAFPGGRADPGDGRPRNTAIRETAEELGLALAPELLLGPLPAIQSPVRPHRDPLVIHPFVFAFDAPLPPLNPDRREVASVHRFALARLLADEGRATFPWRFRGQTLEMPCILMDGCRIWGLSLHMLDDLMDRL